MKVKIKKLNPEMKMPNYAHPGDVGLDLFSMEDKILMPGERYLFMVGFALEFPVGYAALIKDKSGLACNHGLHGVAGVYDAGYRGEYGVPLINLSHEAYKIEKGHKIAQLLIIPVEIAELELVEELSESSRGAGRLGSTGKF